MGEALTLGIQGRGVWITRVQPGADATAKRVAALGFEPLVEPLLTVRGSPAILNLQPSEALAFTSSQGLLHLPPEIPRDRRVFAVGDATAEAARQVGFTDVLSANGDVKALAALILKESPLAVAHLAAQRTAGELARSLSQAGLPARRVTTYTAEARTALPPAVEQAVMRGGLTALLIHSPRAAQIAADLIARQRLTVSTVKAFGLSAACVAPLAQSGFRGLHSATTPTEASLLTLLVDL